MKRIFVMAFAGAALAASTLPLKAALPPIHDRMKQFAAVVDTAGVADALSQYGLVDRIEQTDDLEFRVYSGKCHVTVTLTAIPPAGGMMGPTRYEGELGETGCD